MNIENILGPLIEEEDRIDIIEIESDLKDTKYALEESEKELGKLEDVAVLLKESLPYLKCIRELMKDKTKRMGLDYTIYEIERALD